MLVTLKVSLLPAKMQGEEAMKLPNQPVVLCVLMVCLTLLIFTWLTRNSLCELRLKDGTREVSAVMDYESGK